MSTMTQDQRDTMLQRTLDNIEKHLRNSADSLRGGGTHGAGGGTGGNGGTNSTIIKTERELRKKQQDLLNEIRETIQEYDALRRAGKVKESNNKMEEMKALREGLRDIRGRLNSWASDQAAKTAANNKAAADAAEVNRLKTNTQVESSISKLATAWTSLSEPLHDDWQAFDKYSLSMNKSIAKQASTLSGMLEAGASGLQNEAYDEYIQSMLGAAKSLNPTGTGPIGDLIRSEEIAKGIQITTATELSEIVDKLQKQARLFESVMKENNGEIKQTLENLWQFQQAGQDIGEAGRAVLEAATAQGLLTAAGVSQSNEEYQRHIQNVKKDMVAMQRHAIAQVQMAKYTQHLSEKFGELGAVLTGQKGAWGAVAVGLSIFAANLGAATNQLRLAADVGMLMGGGGILGSFRELKKAQFQLGLSFEETAKMFQENRRLAFTAGGSSIRQFADALNDGQRSLIELGMSNEDAGKSAVDFAQNAVKAGIDIRESKDLKKAIKSQSEAYGRLKLLTGASASEFKALNEELYNTQSVQEQLNGLSNQERINRMNSMMSLREDFVKLGLSAQSANKALISIQDLGKQKLSERFTQAAKVQQMAGMLGMKNGAQLAAIAKKGTRASEEERKILMEGMVELRKRADQSRLGSYGMENVIQSLEAGLSGPLATMYEAGVEANKTTSALGKFAETKFGEQTVEDDIKIPGWAATLIEIESSTKQILGDPILKALGGMAISLVGIGFLGKQLMMILTHVRAIASKMVANVGGVQGAGKFGKILKGAGAITAMGIGAEMMGDAYDDVQAKRKAKAEGGDITERTAYNDLGMIIPPSYLPDWLTELDEYDASGRRLTDAEKKARGQKVEPKKPEVSSPSTKPSEAKPIVTMTGLVGTASGVGNSYPGGSNPKSIYSVAPGATNVGMKTITPIGSSTSGSSSESNSEVNAPIIKLSSDTIAKLGAFLTSINDTETKALNIEQQQLDMLVSLVGANDEALREAKKLPPIPGQSRMFGRGDRYEHVT